MGIICKTGFYRKVARELAKTKIPSRDIHLLFGPMNILCEFEFETIGEFKERWFNRVRTIGGEEEWITQTMTFFVIESGGEILRMHSTLQKSLWIYLGS